MALSLLALAAVVCLSANFANSGNIHRASHDDLGAHLDNTELSDTNSMMQLFDAWQAKHQVEFKDEQDRIKAFNQIFENARKIKQHRGEHKSGEHSYNVDLNQFSHMSFEEFKASRLGHVGRDRSGAKVSRNRRAVPPNSVDWKAAGYTTPPKDQGDCGCCWTFATTGAIEGAYFKKNKQLIKFSQQQLVDCVPDFQGCDGGAAPIGVDFIHSMGGLAADATYPYTSMTGTFGACKSVPLVAMSPSYLDVPHGDDLSLMNALATSGPIATTISVGQLFMSYTAGVLHPATACEAQVNHAVLLVGYGKDAATGQNYWLVKNSWGPTWGEGGYFRLNRDVPNSCGISSEAIQVTL